MAKPVSIAETLDLSAFRMPMQPLPARVEEAIARGVVSAKDRAPAPARLLAGKDADGLVDGVIRHRDGTMTIACLTEFQGATPAMIDWWFGWRLGVSERWHLAHPKAYQKVATAADRSRDPDARARFIGNSAFVDMHIGPALFKVALDYRPPSAFGFDPRRADAAGTAICAQARLRERGVVIGRIAHLVRRTDEGCEMLSRHYLGDFRFTAPLIGPLATAILKGRRLHRRLIPDDAGLFLLRQCAEEMNGLAVILPRLYGAFGEA